MPLEPTGLAALIERHAGPLRLWAGRRCPSPEDAVQEAFCQLVTLESPPNRPAAWLYVAVRNAAANQLRAHVRRRELEKKVSESERHEADPAAGIIDEELIRAVEELEDSLREVLVARIWGELTLDETAALCGISTATAHRRYEAAIADVRKKMDVPCLNQVE